MRDEDIVALYLARREDAIVQTGEKYGRLCTSIAMNVLGDSRDAEECVQDTYLAAWDQIPPDRPQSLRAYLGRITRNLAVSLYRKNRAKKRYVPMETMLSELEDCLPAPEDTELRVDRIVLGESISDWLDGLDKPSRDLFIRRYWYGDSVERLARDMGIRPNSLAQKLRRMRLSLMKELERQGF